MPTCEKILTNGWGMCDEEIPCVIHYDYQPFEPREAYYPGCPEEVTIYDVEPTDGREISLLPEYIGLLEEEILQDINYENSMEGDWC